MATSQINFRNLGVEKDVEKKKKISELE